MQRRELFQVKREQLFNDEVIRKQEIQLDLDEAKINNHSH
jgi:CPA1 family monovalent cation:H+ antiporter